MRRLTMICARTALLLATIAGAGCHRYSAEIVVDENGGGTRNATMRLRPDPEDGPVTVEDLARMAGMDARRGWRLAAESDRARMDAREGEYIYTMTGEADGVDGWTRMNGSITVRGALEPGEYGSVMFGNEVSVGLGAVTNGKTYTYRESFRWEGLLDAIVRFQSEMFARRMQREYPHLDPEALAELRGIMAGQLAVAFAQLRLWQDDGVDEGTISASVASQAARVVSRAGTEADPARVYDVAAACLDDEDEEFERFIAADLPGVLHVGATTIELTLHLPGTIVETNGTVGEDGAVRWKMELFDAFGRPVEFRARSELLR